MRRVRVELKKSSGQAIVEFALVLPLFILLMVGILDFGLFFNSYINVAFSSKEGARMASLDTSLSNLAIEASVKATMPSASNVTVTVSPPAPRITGSLVAVTVSAQHTFFTPVISSLLPSNPYTISSATSMRSE